MRDDSQSPSTEPQRWASVRPGARGERVLRPGIWYRILDPSAAHPPAASAPAAPEESLHEHAGVAGAFPPPEAGPDLRLSLDGPLTRPYFPMVE
jgi:hypothetical protein